MQGLHSYVNLKLKLIRRAKEFPCLHFPKYHRVSFKLYNLSCPTFSGPELLRRLNNTLIFQYGYYKFQHPLIILIF